MLNWYLASPRLRARQRGFAEALETQADTSKTRDCIPLALRKKTRSSSSLAPFVGDRALAATIAGWLLRRPAVTRVHQTRYGNRPVSCRGCPASPFSPVLLAVRGVTSSSEARRTPLSMACCEAECWPPGPCCEKNRENRTNAPKQEFASQRLGSHLIHCACSSAVGVQFLRLDPFSAPA